MKIKVSNNDYEQGLYQTLCDNKLNAFNSLLEYLKPYIETEQIDFNESNLKLNIVKLFIDTYRNDFPPIVLDEKIIEMTSFNVQKLDLLINNFRSFDVEFDYKTKTTPKKDFGIYVTKEEQMEKYESLNKLVSVMNNETNKIIMGIGYRQQLCSLMGNIIGFDPIKNSFEVNLNYVLSI